MNRDQERDKQFLVNMSNGLHHNTQLLKDIREKRETRPDFMKPEKTVSRGGKDESEFNGSRR